MGNVRNHRNIKLVTTNFKRKLLVSKPNYHTCKRFSKDLMATELKRTKSDHHTITTEEVNKIALSRKDDKRIQSFGGITVYPHGIDKDLLN